MDLHDLIRALLVYDTLAARQWVADSLRKHFDWSTLPEPLDLDAVSMTIAAGVAELLAGRIGQKPPAWTSAVQAIPSPIVLVKAALTMPRLRRLCEEEGPEPLRRRGILAPPEFLTIV